MSPRDVAEKLVATRLTTLITCAAALVGAGFAAANAIRNQTAAVQDLSSQVSALVDQVWEHEEAKAFARELAYRNPTLKVPDPRAIINRETSIPVIPPSLQ